MQKFESFALGCANSSIVHSASLIFLARFCLFGAVRARSNFSREGANKYPLLRDSNF